MSRVRILEVPTSTPVLTVARQKPRGQREHVRVSSSRVVLHCVFHEERSPSLFLYPDGFYRCYGCGKCGRDWRDNIEMSAKAARLLGLRGDEAQTQLSFHAPLPSSPPPPPESE